MKNKILIGIGTFVAILAVIGILAFSFTMTPVAATNITNATEFINITCTTAILLNDSNINGGAGSLLQSCIDLYTNQSAAVVSSKNETNGCWSGQSTFDYIKLLNKGNNWLKIDLNLTEDAGFIGQTGGSQFSNINNTLYVQVRNGNTYGGSISNDGNASCLNVTAFNETVLQKGVSVTVCGALAWETTRNDLLIFKKWFIQPKTAPGGYNFTETISATQVGACGGSDPTLSPGYGNITSMLAGTGTNNQLDVMSSIYGSEASPSMLITTPTVTTPSPVSSIDFLANAPNANLPAGTAAIGIYNNFNTAASTNSVFTVTATATSTKTVSGLPAPNANFTNAQVAFSGDGSVMYIVMTQTAAPIGTLYKCTLNATGYNYAATDSLSTVTGDAITWIGGYTNIGNFDPTSSAAYYALLYNTTSAPRKFAVIKDDGSRSLVIKYDITTSMPATETPRDIAVDTEYNVMYALISTGMAFPGQVVQMPLGRTGNTISSVGLMNAFFDANIAPNTAAGVGTRQMGTVPTLVFPNAY